MYNVVEGGYLGKSIQVQSVTGLSKQVTPAVSEGHAHQSQGVIRKDVEGFPAGAPGYTLACVSESYCSSA
jgi:hypothetical protein